MDHPSSVLPFLLGTAVLLPLASFFVIFLGAKWIGKSGTTAAWIAVLAIGSAAVLSFLSLGVWLANHSLVAAEHHTEQHHTEQHHTDGNPTDEPGEPHASHAQVAPKAEHVGPSSTELAATEPQVVRGQGAAAQEKATAAPTAAEHSASNHSASNHSPSDHATAEHSASEQGEHAAQPVPVAYSGDFRVPGLGTPWVLGQFGNLRITISYYIDALTIGMFCMVTLIATLIHIYAMGYMHDELHDVTDREVTVSTGGPLHRPGRFHHFFQYLSLFCFSMLGLVIAGNIAMVFVFWELVGICSYFLIGFYIERKSASTAANKAFITNRVGDFGMIIGLLALWTSLGTFSFADTTDGFGRPQPGLFSQVRGEHNAYRLVTPDGMVVLSAQKEVSRVAQELGPEARPEELQAAVKARIPDWRDGHNETKTRYGYWLLIVAGIGIFTGCVGKSAQFPLHVWLPDAMEGPTPVSALVHSATMVAAGVYLVGRFYPVFVPEVLLVIAVIGCITLFMAATIAITATDIKRVLAYSTISQLGYMMLSLGVGGWLAGMMHLITHAFFKSLLFMCSGSVIHAVHTNDMREMGGLLKKMPVTAYTMLVGCLAIAGAGIPFMIGWLGGPPLAGLGFSGFYSKDAILEQAYSFMQGNPSGWAGAFFFAAAGGAAITAFYMFRMWYLTFVGKPRNQERFDHAHESPPVMYVPLIILAVMAVTVAWTPFQGMIGGLMGTVVFLLVKLLRGPSERVQPAGSHETDGSHGSHGSHDSHGHDMHSHAGHGHSDSAGLLGWLPVSDVPLAASVLVFVLAFVNWVTHSNLTLSGLLESARPAGTLATATGVLLSRWVWPNEHLGHLPSIAVPVTLLAIGTAFAGFLLATLMYGYGKLNADEVRRQFHSAYRFLVNKWWFDELYNAVFIKPTLIFSRFVASIDRNWIDRFVDGLAVFTKSFSVLWDRVADRTIVDGSVNLFASWTYSLGLALRGVQTGKLRQYVMFIVIGAVAIFVLISLWNSSLAAQ